MWRCIFATVVVNSFLIFPSTSAENKAYITLENCRLLTAHTPRDDVAYKAGVDRRGNSVAPADISTSIDLGLKDKISFLLILDVAKESGIKENNGDTGKQFADHPGLKGDMNLGRIDVVNGKATLDGKILGGQQFKALNEFCKKSKNYLK